jgi:hypothetical protein
MEEGPRLEHLPPVGEPLIARLLEQDEQLLLWDILGRAIEQILVVDAGDVAQ